MGARLALGALGVLVGLYGGWLVLTELDGAEITSAVVWLVGGVVAHDALVAGVTLLVTAVGARVLPDAVRAPAATGLVVLGAAVLLAVPVLGGFGAEDSNPTLLDRNYWLGLLGLAVVVAVGVAVASVRRARRD